MISFLKLIRYKNLLMVLLTLVLTKYALIHSFIPLSYLTNFQFLILAISILCITAAGYIINDVFDIQVDKINKPSKVVINQNISIKSAKISYYILTITGVILGILLSLKKEEPFLSIIFIATSIGLFSYSKYLKRIPLIGNLIIALLIGISIFTIVLFEFAQVKQVENIHDSFYQINAFIAVFIYTLFSFLTTLIREIIKDIEDIKGDYAFNMKTLPIIIGINRCKKVAFFLASILFVFLIYIIKEEVSNYTYLFLYSILCIIIPVIWLLYKLWNAKTNKHYHQLSNLLKTIMLLGILSMILFKFN